VFLGEWKGGLREIRRSYGNGNGLRELGGVRQNGGLQVEVSEAKASTNRLPKANSNIRPGG